MTINCAERGLLLLRVRDEIRMTVAAFQTLYESSVAFGMRKALQSEQGKSEMEQRVCFYIMFKLLETFSMIRIAIVIIIYKKIKNSCQKFSTLLFLVILCENLLFLNCFWQFTIYLKIKKALSAYFFFKHY